MSFIWGAPRCSARPGRQRGVARSHGSDLITGLCFGVAFIYCKGMHATILRMLSTGSLSAFSASVAQAGLGLVQQARAASSQPLQASPATPQSSSSGSSGMSLGTPPSGRVLPRGSLLDLSV